ncbi:MAG: hypothetical protein ACE149_14270 [Armatimonadota bacterium]
MSSPSEPLKSTTAGASTRRPDPTTAIRLEPRFVPATESQLLIIDTARRLLAVWAVRAAGAPSDSA